MISEKDNRLLTEVQLGAPMNALIRQYWIPALLTRDAPEAGGLPLRVRLLGEDLLFFRSREGELGLVGAYCPHRGASLYFARNEDCGLRCVYHGWKFNAKGDCVDLPNETRAVDFKNRVKLTSYQVREKGGIIWAFLGDQSRAPALPALEWLDLPANQVHLSMRIQRCNWLQALEGEIDTSHAGILHSRVDGAGANAWDKVGAGYASPDLEVEATDYGVMIASRRALREGKCYWRVNQFMLPFFTIVPPSGSEPDINGHAWVPIDNHHTLCVMYSYKPTEPYSERREKLYTQGARGREPGHATKAGLLPFDPRKPYGMYWPKYSIDNDFGLDPGLQDSKYFSGMAGLWPQDAGVQESMGPIADRTKEHLCSSDLGIIRVRKVLKEVALDIAEGKRRHRSMDDPNVYQVRSVGIVIDANAEWKSACFPHLTAGGGFAYEML